LELFWDTGKGLFLDGKTAKNSSFPVPRGFVMSVLDYVESLDDLAAFYSPDDLSILNDLVYYKSFDDRASSSFCARSLAETFQSPTGIQKSSEKWNVFGSTFIKSACTVYVDDDDSPNHFDSRYDEDTEYRREFLEPLIEELHGDQDAWALSEDDGWFYGD
jgi:hypothetical protein